MEFFKKNWLSIILFLVLAYVAWMVYQKNQGEKDKKPAAPGNTGIAGNLEVNQLPEPDALT